MGTMFQIGFPEHEIGQEMLDPEEDPTEKLDLLYIFVIESF
jgi:hypothetical protein